MATKGKKQRHAANAAEASTLTLNERILKECHQLYTDPENGLIKIAASINLKLLPPRKKITVLLIGNHSAGKSTFINWYIEEHILKAGVAIETQGFTFVTSGRKRESLTGNATLHLYPHFKPLNEIKGLIDYLTTEVSTSKQKKFSLVTFIDTPGLVDGDMNYPFDVEKTILFLGDISDLIFVFFDPIGQALCKRTLNLVQGLNEKHGDRIKMYLSKADDAGHEADRQKVLMQIVQELCKRPGLNKAGFDLPTIFIPNPNKPAKCLNQIEEVCKDIEKTINRTVQNTLNSLEGDCVLIEETVANMINTDKQNKSQNLRSGGKSILFLLAGSLVHFTVLLVSLVSSETSSKFIGGILGQSAAEAISIYTSYLHAVWTFIPSDYHTMLWCGLMLASLFFMFLSWWLFRLKSTLTRKQKRALLEKSDYVGNVVKLKKHHLYQEYLRQSIADHDL